MKININDLILYKGDPNFKYGVAKAYLNHMAGKETRSYNKPILVKFISEEKKYLVIDGYHRVVKYLLEGKKNFICSICNKNTEEWVPPKNKRFILENYKKEKTMKLTTKMLKQIIKEELSAVMTEGYFYNLGVTDAEMGVNNSDEYRDPWAKSQYEEGHASVSAQVELEPPMDDEKAGMPVPSDFEMSGGDGKQSGPFGGKLNPQAAFQKRMMRRLR